MMSVQDSQIDETDPIDMDFLLIQPPALKASEPPLGLAVLLAHLREQGLAAEAIDANLGATLYLLDEKRLAAQAGEDCDTYLRRALRYRADSLDQIRGADVCSNLGRYNTAVAYLNRLLGLWRGESGDERLTLGDYRHSALSPFSPEDLARLARGEASTLFADYFRQQLLPQVEALNPRYISLSINYLHQALPALELAGMLRRLLPETVLVAGGGLISSWQEPLRRLSLRLPPFDRLVIGPGEAPLTALASGRAGDDYCLNDSSRIGFAADFSFADLRDYLSPLPALPLCASRGCYWQRCLFCPEAATPTHPYVGERPADFITQLLQLSRRHDVRHFHLTDNALPVNILMEMANGSSDLHGLAWFGFVRFEQILEKAGFAEALAQNGCRMLQLGLESGSQQLLDRLEKGVRLEAAARILERLRAAGIATYVYIMLGTPGETKQDAERTLAFLEKHAENISFLNISIMNLPRASGLLDNPGYYGISVTDPLENDQPLSLYRTFRPEGTWDRGAARSFLNSRLLASPLIRNIVNRTPPLFTSNHAAFFNDAS